MHSVYFILLLCAATPALAQKSAVEREARKLFEAYKPSIEKQNKAIVQPPTAVVGDVNGDGREDCLLHFVMTPNEGGNAVVGRETAVYLNTGNGIKVAGSFPEVDFCYTPQRIQNGIIYVEETVCAPPYNDRKGERRFQYANGKINEVK